MLKQFKMYLLGGLFLLAEMYYHVQLNVQYQNILKYAQVLHRKGLAAEVT